MAAAPGAPATELIDDLDRLPFDDRVVADLPADPSREVRPRQVEGAAHSFVDPTPTAGPRTLAVSSEVVELLGLHPDVVAGDDFAAVFSGNRVPAGARPWAAAYGGHQFGSWAGQLGDGRAIALGEVLDVHGGHQTLQLKGAGPTPYSRTADGRAVLRSSVREFLCSEAMHHLGVPTTRALSLVLTGDQVLRDVMYDGNPAWEPGAVVCRVAPSFTRFGTFQLPASRGDHDLLQRLIDWTIRDEAPDLADDPDLGPDERVAAWFARVVDRTVDLVVDWMRVGFVHGVLNTDNMSTRGLTIDYGPYGWLEPFDPDWTPNTTDAGMRRYRYGAQPAVAQWNLLQLANALAQVAGSADGLQAALDRFADRYRDGFRAMLAARLGWGDPRSDDEAITAGLFELLVRTEVDQVIFFRDLARVPVDAEDRLDDDALLAPIGDAFYAPDEVTGDLRSALAGWLRTWGRRVVDGGLGDDERRRRMDALNPRFVLRNYLAQEAIDAAAAGDAGLLHELHDVLRRPYDEQPGKERFAAKRPEWARQRVGCSMLSCSS
jgi:serine/tyrosine/threonine adenylyltransferase